MPNPSTSPLDGDLLGVVSGKGPLSLRLVPLMIGPALLSWQVQFTEWPSKVWVKSRATGYRESWQ